MNWSRIIGNIGRTLIGSGTLILLFVAYQLWGTAIQERRAQGELSAEFDEALAQTLGEGADDVRLDDDPLPSSLEPEAVTPAASVGAASDERIRTGNLGTTDVIDLSGLPGSVVSADFGPPPPPAENGEAVAEIRIPRLGLTKWVVEGVGTEDLKKGPGHYPGTPLPGQAGNAAIAGHRTTYGAPFEDLDQLEENDLIYVTTLQGSFVYRVTETIIVAPKDVYVLDPSDDNRLTLTTCHPKLTARQRMIVVAELLGDPAPSDPEQLLDSGEQVAALPSEGDGPQTVPTTIVVDDPSQLADLIPGDEQPEAPFPTTVPAPQTDSSTQTASFDSIDSAGHGLSGSGDA
ncbi:MAG: class E sortase, partial [Acidimicrobiales bacterium]|nr:class E sortase [Acidimicrobiales bacterium]